MRIGLLIYGSLDTVSGGYLYDRMLVRELRAAGHQVEIFSLPWRSYPAHLTDNLAMTFAARIAAARLDILIQDELNHPSLFWLNRILRRQLTCPIIAIVHHLRSQETHPRPFLPLYRAVERAYLATLDGCIYNSRTTRATTEALLGRALPHVIAYPAGDHIQPPARAAVLSLLQRRGASRRPLQVLTVGNVIPRKGLHHVVSALAALSPDSWRLHIVGSTRTDPSYVAQVRNLARSLGIGSNLIWHGALDDDSLRAQYHTADMFALPSYEGFGIAYLEAMAHGLPVIASTSGAAHEVITSGIHGYLIEPNDPTTLSLHMHSFAANRSLLAVLGYYARLRYEQASTWHDSMSRALSWLREAIREGPTDACSH